MINIFPTFYFFKKNIVRRQRNNDYLLNKEKARRIISSRLDFFTEKHNLSYNRLSIRDQRTRWGSCSQKRNLNFNYRLIYLPDDLRDYVIVHELCHLTELNHGKNFWNLVSQILPNYKELRFRLKNFKLII